MPFLFNMNNNEKAVAQLNSCDITAKIENNTVYVCIDGIELELAEFEINFRAKLYDEENS